MNSKLCSGTFGVMLHIVLVLASEVTYDCRDRSGHLRGDGGLCFEIPPWQHQTVELESHLSRLRERLSNNSYERRQTRTANIVLVNSEASRYIDAVIAPFLDTYYRNIQNAYQQLADKILARIKSEINVAVIKKNDVLKELNDLAETLKVPVLCDEERREILNTANRHLSEIYGCTVTARASIAEIGIYAEETVATTRVLMYSIIGEITQCMEKNQQPETGCIRQLSKSAVKLGYELDLSLTNVRRHSEQSCDKFTACTSRVRRQTSDGVDVLHDLLYQCVYA